MKSEGYLIEKTQNPFSHVEIKFNISEGSEEKDETNEECSQKDGVNRRYKKSIFVSSIYWTLPKMSDFSSSIFWALPKNK